MKKKDTIVNEEAIVEENDTLTAEEQAPKPLKRFFPKAQVLKTVTQMMKSFKGAVYAYALTHSVDGVVSEDATAYLADVIASVTDRVVRKADSERMIATVKLMNIDEIKLLKEVLSEM